MSINYINTINKYQLKRYSSLVLFFLACLSFFIGFFLRENLAGGGIIDLEHEWHNYNLLKNNLTAFIYGNYEASRFPFFHILNILFNKFIDSQNDYINSFFIYSLFLPIIFYFTLKSVFISQKNYHILLITSILILSPYFRTSSFWGLQENLSYIFFMLSIYIYEKFRSKNYLLIFVSFLSFYSDQKFFFVPIIFLSIMLFENKKINLNKIKLLLFSFILFIPSLIIFYYWGGITPKVTTSGINKEGFYPQNIIYVVNIMALYLTPFLILNIKKINLKKILNFKFILISILSIIIFYLAYRFYLKTDLIYGGGWAYKIYQFFSTKNIFLAEAFFSLSFIASSFILIIYFKNIEKNFVNIIILFFLFSYGLFIGSTFQEYYDPLMLFIIVFFFEKKNIFHYDFFKFLILFFYFFAFILGTSIYRYFFI